MKTEAKSEKAIRRLLNITAPKVSNVMSPSEFKSIIKLGMIVETNGDSFQVTPTRITGKIGEFDDGAFCVWQNDHPGRTGMKRPRDFGCLYGWQVAFDNKKAYVRVLHTNESEDIF